MVFSNRFEGVHIIISALHNMCRSIFDDSRSKPWIPLSENIFSSHLSACSLYSIIHFVKINICWIIARTLFSLSLSMIDTKSTILVFFLTVIKKITFTSVSFKSIILWKLCVKHLYYQNLILIKHVLFSTLRKRNLLCLCTVDSFAIGIE